MYLNKKINGQALARSRKSSIINSAKARGGVRLEATKGGKISVKMGKTVNVDPSTVFVSSGKVVSVTVGDRLPEVRFRGRRLAMIRETARGFAALRD